MPSAASRDVVGLASGCRAPMLVLGAPASSSYSTYCTPSADSSNPSHPVRPPMLCSLQSTICRGADWHARLPLLVARLSHAARKA